MVTTTPTPPLAAAGGPPATRPGLPWRRLPVLLSALASLVAALWGGLLLLGLPVPTITGTTASQHGVLMVLGFLGTVISLERAVALGRPWGFLAPACAGLGGVGGGTSGRRARSSLSSATSSAWVGSSMSSASRRGSI